MKPSLWITTLALALTLPACGDDGSTDAGTDAAAAVDAAVTADAASAVDDAATATDDAATATDDAATATDDAASSTCQTTTLEEPAADVLFLSESDRPFELAQYGGEGDDVSATNVARLWGAPAEATITVRDTASFFRAFEPNVGASEEAPAVFQAAIEAELSDLLYVAIVLPAEPAVVHVILAGRNECGDLVTVESVSIET